MEADMTLRPMTAAEQMYSYYQSQQISVQTGLIGYLRADMDNSGKGFFSCWNGFRDSLKSEVFKQEYDEVLNDCVRTGTFCMTAIPWADTATERRTVLFTMIGTNMASVRIPITILI